MSPTGPITIIIDDRERAGGLASALGAIAGLRVATARLAVGDAWIGERVAIERKEAADFIASLMDGRLERQARALAGLDAMTAVMIIEGEFSAKTLAGMAAGEVRAAILSLQIDWGIVVVRSRNVNDTARWIETLARRQAGALSPIPLTLDPSRPAHPHPAGHRKLNQQSAMNNQKSVPLAALERIPGLGPVRARALLEHFGSMARLVAATETELAEAPGIGPALAHEIRSALAH